MGQTSDFVRPSPPRCNAPPVTPSSTPASSAPCAARPSPTEAAASAAPASGDETPDISLVGKTLGGKYRVVAAARRGGHGRGLRGRAAARHDVAQGRRQDAPPAPVARREDQGALRARGRHHRWSSSTRTPSRSTTTARPTTASSTSRWSSSRAEPRGPPREGGRDRARPRRAIMEPGVRLARGGARARHRPPRPQARQRRARRARRQEGLREGARLRDRQAVERGRQERAEAHAAGDGARHAAVHEPRAVHREAHRRAERHLLAGDHGLRDADGHGCPSRRTRRGSGRRST